MSERSEQIAEITIDNKLFPVRRENLSVFRHIGEYAMYDHCHIQSAEGVEGYIWSYNPIFDKYLQLAIDHAAYMELNKSKPDEIVLKYFSDHVSDVITQRR